MVGIMRSVRAHVGRVDLGAHGLPDQIDRQHESRMRALANQATHDAPEWPVHHFDSGTLGDQRARIVLQLTLHESTDTLDFNVRNGSGFGGTRDNADDSGARENRDLDVRVDTPEAIAWEEWPVESSSSGLSSDSSA